jgi:hypothetical protein
VTAQCMSIAGSKLTVLAGNTNSQPSRELGYGQPPDASPAGQNGPWFHDQAPSTLAGSPAPQDAPKRPARPSGPPEPPVGLSGSYGPARPGPPARSGRPAAAQRPVPPALRKIRAGEAVSDGEGSVRPGAEGAKGRAEKPPDIERRRVATGANHPASHSSAFRRGPGTPAVVPRRGTRAPI